MGNHYEDFYPVYDYKAERLRKNTEAIKAVMNRFNCTEEEAIARLEDFNFMSWHSKNYSS